MPQNIVTFTVPFVKNTKEYVKFDIPFNRQQPGLISMGGYIPRELLPDGQGYELVVTVRKVATRPVLVKNDATGS